MVLVFTKKKSEANQSTVLTKKFFLMQSNPDGCIHGGVLCQLPKLTTLLWNKNRIYFLRPLRKVWLTTAEKLTDLFDFFISCACFCLRIFIKSSSSIIVIRLTNSHYNSLLFHLRKSQNYRTADLSFTNNHSKITQKKAIFSHTTISYNS